MYVTYFSLAVKAVLQQQLISLKGEKNHYIGPDLLTEIQNRFGR